MFTKQLTRAPQYILIKSSSFYIARLKLSHDLSRRFLKTSKIHFKSASFSTEIGRTRTIELFMIRPPKLRRMIRCTQHFQQIGLTWLTQWSNLTSLWYGQFSLSLGKAPTFPLQSYTLKWGPVRAGAQLIRVNSDKQHGRGTATLEEKWWQDRVVTRWRSEIKSKKWGGIWEHKPWDQDQHYCKEIMDSVVRHNNRDHNILKCAQHFSIQLYFCCNISIRY